MAGWGLAKKQNGTPPCIYENNSSKNKNNE